MTECVPCVLADARAEKAVLTTAILSGAWPSDLEGFSLQCAALQPGTADTYVGVFLTTVESASVDEAVHMAWLPMPLQTVLLRSSAVRVALVAFQGMAGQPRFWLAGCAEAAPKPRAFFMWSAAHWELALQQWAPDDAQTFVESVLQPHCERLLQDVDLRVKATRQPAADDEEAEFMTLPPSFATLETAQRGGVHSDSEGEDALRSDDDSDAHSDDGDAADNADEGEDEENDDNAEIDDGEHMDDDENDTEEDDLESDTDDSDDGATPV